MRYEPVGLPCPSGEIKLLDAMVADGASRTEHRPKEKGVCSVCIRRPSESVLNGLLLKIFWPSSGWGFLPNFYHVLLNVGLVNKRHRMGDISPENFRPCQQCTSRSVQKSLSNWLTRSITVSTSFGAMKKSTFVSLRLCLYCWSINNNYVKKLAVHIAVLIKEQNASRHRSSIFLTHHLTLYTLPVVDMAHFSNVIFNDGSFKFNSAQGDLHIHNRVTESGMHNLRSV